MQFAAQKNQLHLSPPLRFSINFPLFLSTQAENNFAKNLGHTLHKKCKIVSFGRSLSEKQPSTFGHFLDIENPIGHLNQ